MKLLLSSLKTASVVLAFAALAFAAAWWLLNTVPAFALDSR